MEQRADVRRHWNEEVVWHIVLVSMKHFCIGRTDLLSLCKRSNKDLMINRNMNKLIEGSERDIDHAHFDNYFKYGRSGYFHRGGVPGMIKIYNSKLSYKK